MLKRTEYKEFKIFTPPTPTNKLSAELIKILNKYNYNINKIIAVTQPAIKIAYFNNYTSDFEFRWFTVKTITMDYLEEFKQCDKLIVFDDEPSYKQGLVRCLPLFDDDTYDTYVREERSKKLNRVLK